MNYKKFLNLFPVKFSIFICFFVYLSGKVFSFSYKKSFKFLMLDELGLIKVIYLVAAIALCVFSFRNKSSDSENEGKVYWIFFAAALMCWLPVLLMGYLPYYDSFFWTIHLAILINLIGLCVCYRKGKRWLFVVQSLSFYYLTYGLFSLENNPYGYAAFTDRKLIFEILNLFIVWNIFSKFFEKRHLNYFIYVQLIS